ncbi:hypothetical protein [Helicobacter sp. 23-1045]
MRFCDLGQILRFAFDLQNLARKICHCENLRSKFVAIYARFCEFRVNRRI